MASPPGTASQSPRASQVLSRRSASCSERSARKGPGITRQRSQSGVSSFSGATYPASIPASRRSSSATEADNGSDSPNRRKLKLDQRISERQEAELKERERDQKKALLKEKRGANQLLVQVRHAANEQHSKVKRGLQEIEKVQSELDRLKKWREKEEERMTSLMQQLLEEQKQMEEEFNCKYDEVEEIKCTLLADQRRLDEDLSQKIDEVKRVESDAAKIEAALTRLEDYESVPSTQKESTQRAVWRHGGYEEVGNTTMDSSTTRFGLDSSIGHEVSATLSPSSSATTRAVAVGLNTMGFDSLVIENGNDLRKAWSSAVPDARGLNVKQAQTISTSSTHAPSASSGLSGKSTLRSSAPSDQSGLSDQGQPGPPNGVVRTSSLGRKFSGPSVSAYPYHSLSILADGATVKALPAAIPVTVRTTESGIHQVQNRPGLGELVNGSSGDSRQASRGDSRGSSPNAAAIHERWAYRADGLTTSPGSMAVSPRRQISSGDGQAPPTLLRQTVSPMPVAQISSGSGSKSTPAPHGQALVSPGLETRNVHSPVYPKTSANTVAAAITTMPVPAQGFFNWEL